MQQLFLQDLTRLAVVMIDRNMETTRRFSVTIFSIWKLLVLSKSDPKYSMADPGFVGLGGGTKLKVGAPTYYFGHFPLKKCMKMKEIRLPVVTVK